MGFQEIIGWPLGWIMKALYTVIPNYGLAIILFTVIIRVLQFPLSVKQQKSSARMGVIQPKLQVLQKKYANNQKKLQEEQMKLYQEYNYSPTSGCLPMIIPLVVLFGLIDVVYKPLTHIVRMSTDLINSATEIAKSVLDTSFISNAPQISIINAVHQSPEAFSELGTDFIQNAQSIDLSFFGINLGLSPTLSWPIIIIPILAGVFALLSSILSMRMNPQTNQGVGMGLKVTMLIMPLFSVWIAFSYPAGLGLYWAASSAIAALQTVVLNKLYDPHKIRETVEAEMEENRKNNRKSSKIEVESVVVDEEGNEKVVKEKISKKEADRRRLAEARKRDAEKYGDEYKEVTDNDLK